MSVRDSFSFRQRPHGPFKLLLRTPVPLFRWGLGGLFRERFLVLVHTGRHTGRMRHTPLEVIARTPPKKTGTNETSVDYIVCSAYGQKADWFRNIKASPAAEVWTGRKKWCPEQYFLSTEEGASVFRSYFADHTKTAERLLNSLGKSHDGSEESLHRLATELPMVRFRRQPAET